MQTAQTARTQRDFGYEVSGNPISRAGVFPYTAKSIGFPGWENDPGKIIMVFRPEEALNNPKTLASARLQPWIDDHTMIGDPANEAGLTPIEHVGARGTLGEQIFYDPDQRAMCANLRLWSPSHEDAIAAGKKDLSMGFRCVYQFKSGEFEGQHYDAVQTNLDFNHVASVDDGRMGPTVAVLDRAHFAFDANDLKEIKPMKTTRRIKTAKLLSVAVDALPAYFGMDSADAAALKAWNTAMDAEEDDGEAAPASGVASAAEAIAAASSIVSELAEPLAELNGALASLSAPPSDVPDDMEQEMDAAGQPVIDPGTGAPKMKKKVAAGTPPGQSESIGSSTPPAVADAVPPALAAADSAIKVMKTASKRAHATLAGAPVPATLKAFDSAIVTGETNLRAAHARHTRTSRVAGLDEAIKRITAIETRLPAMDTAQNMTPKQIMQTIADRDALYNRVSPAIGAFDHSTMTAEDVAVYACDKLDLKPAKGSELAALNGYLHNRPIETPRAASSFALDASIKSSSKAQDFISGKTAA